MSNMDSELSKLNAALQRYLLSRNHKYTSIKALFLAWDKTPSGRRTDAAQLGTLLKNTYHMDVEYFTIPSTDSQVFLQRKLDDYYHPALTCRAILIYYNGGAQLKATADGKKPVWRPIAPPTPRRSISTSSYTSISKERRPSYQQVDEPEIDWLSIQDRLERRQSNILIITDCDYGRFSRNTDGEGITPFRRMRTNAPSKFEILSAPSDVPADALEDCSFTGSIITALNQLATEDVNMRSLSTVISSRETDETHNHEHLNLSQGHDHSSIEIQVVRKEKLNQGSRTLPIEDLRVVLMDQARLAPSGVRNIQIAQDGTNSLEMIVYLDESLVGKGVPYTKWISGVRRHIQPGDASTMLLRRREKEVEEYNAYIEALVRRWNLDQDWGRIIAPHRVRYNKVVVLPIMFQETGFDQETDVSLVEEMEELLVRFREKFDFLVEAIYRIPSTDSQTALKTKVERAIGMAGQTQLGKHDLLIVVYSGHGESTLEGDGQARWAGKHGTTVCWSEIQSMLYAANCDVAQILDCCFGASAAKSADCGRNELITASSSQHETYTGTGSFLKMITKGLDQWLAQGKPFSMQDLFNRVTSLTTEHNANPKNKKNLQPTRFHQLLDGRPGSICLRPRSYKDASEDSPLPARSPDDPAAPKYVLARVEITSHEQPGQIEYYAGDYSPFAD